MANESSDAASAPKGAGTRSTRGLTIIGVIAVVGLALSAIIANGVLEAERQVRHSEVQGKLTSLVERIETETNAHLVVLRGLRSYFDSEGLDSWAGFERFTAALKSTEIGALAYGWSPRVPVSLKGGIDRFLSEEGTPGRVISELTTRGLLLTENGAESYYPIVAVEPAGGVSGVLGKDLAKIPEVKDALKASVEQNEIIFSKPMTSFGSVEKKRVIIAVFPFYRPDSPNFTYAQRDRNATGIVYAVLDFERILQFSLTDSLLRDVVQEGAAGLKITASVIDGDESPLLKTKAYDVLLDREHSDAILNPVVSDTRNLQLGLLPIKIKLETDLDAVAAARLNIPLSIFVAGLILTAVLCAYTHTLISREGRVRALVVDRTLALEQNERRLRDMAEISSDWFWEMDADLRFVHFSERFGDVVGSSPEKFLGRTRLEVFGKSRDEVDEIWAAHLDDLDNHRAFGNFRYSVRTDDGDIRWLAINGKPIFDEGGNFSGYWGSGRNVTAEETALRNLSESERQMHRYIEELEISRQYLEENTAEMAQLAEQYAVEKERAETSEKSKSEFLASMSHEIRTPMTGVMGFADMLLDSSLDAEEREMVIKIKGATQSLLTIINDILDLSKLEAGRLEIENLDFDFRGTVNESIDLVRERARIKGLDLKTSLDKSIPDGLNADPTRIRQIMINLIGNAVKFTHRGSVTVVASKIDEDAQELLRVEIKDTGIGISEENRAHLFQDFSQADASITRRYEGTGLGLAISKRLVELMGGKIGVDSVEGEGSTFWFTLPYREATTDVTRHSRRAIIQDFEALRPLHILVAEDNKLNQRIVEATLDKYGHTCTIVENGALATEAIGTEQFDLILMDVRMPEMSGPDATRVIRARSDEWKDIPIIALTADAMQEHIQGYTEAGMNACVTKPIDRTMLLLTMNDILDESVHVAVEQEEEVDSLSAPVVELNSSSSSTENEGDAANAVTDFLKGLEEVSDEIDREIGTKS